jgi:hypothetical protein
VEVSLGQAAQYGIEGRVPSRQIEDRRNHFIVQQLEQNVRAN